MKKVVIAIGIVVFLGIIALTVGNPYGNDRQVTIHVTDKDRVCSSDSGDGTRTCQYLVYTDEGTFKNVDSILNHKWNSSDVQGELKRDHTYVVKVEGFRSGWRSEYPNIISVVEEVSQ
jgi:hypothetical protein